MTSHAVQALNLLNRASQVKGRPAPSKTAVQKILGIASRTTLGYYCRVIRAPDPIKSTYRAPPNNGPSAIACKACPWGVEVIPPRNQLILDI